MNPPPSPSHHKTVDSVQILRGLAALLVVIDHSALQIAIREHGLMLGRGAAGVDIFFVISGFVIYLTGRHLPPAEFFKRRLIRIAPLYWLFLTLKLAFTLLGGFSAMGAAHGPNPATNPVYLICSYLFLPAYRDAGYPVPPIIAAWSLNYEVYFYLGFTLLLMFCRNHLLKAATAWIVLAAIASTFLWRGGDHHEPALTMLLSPICLEFLAGMWLAAAWVKGHELPMWLTGVLIAGGIALVLAVPEPALFAQNRVLLWGIPAMAIVSGMVMLERHVRFGHWRVLLLLGDASYAIYLSHTVVLPLADKVVMRLHLPWIVELAGLGILATLGGLAVHLCVEKPMTAFLRNRLAPPRARPAMA